MTPANDPELRATIEAVSPVDLRSRDNPTRDPRVVSALWDGARLLQATPVVARPVQSAVLGTPRPAAARPLLAVAPAPSTPTFPGAVLTGDPRSPEFAAAVTGRLFFTMDGVPRTCTAQVIRSTTGGVLATAGHCLLSSGEVGPRVWAQNMMFVPGFRDGAGPLGRWFATGVTVAVGWERDQDWSQDVGFVRLRDRAGGVRLQELVGGFGAVFGALTPPAVAVLGYPATGRFNGSRIESCRGPAIGPVDPADAAALAVPCDLTAGYSGGPWVSGQQPGQLLAVSSHDYGSGTLYGARLGAGALEAFRRADVPS